MMGVVGQPAVVGGGARLSWWCSGECYECKKSVGVLTVPGGKVMGSGGDVT